MVWIIWELAPSWSRLIGLLTGLRARRLRRGARRPSCSTGTAGDELKRFTAGGDPNDLAMTLALALPMAWYLGMTYQQPDPPVDLPRVHPGGLMAIGLTGVARRHDRGDRRAH